MLFTTLQKIGKSFMLPIAILPAAGLLLGIGGALSNPNTVAAYPALDHAALQAVFQVMSAAGTAVFANLFLLLTVGLCIGMARQDKGTAALAGVVGYLVMNATITALLTLNTPEGQAVVAIDTGAVGALVMGALAVWLHNRYHNIALPQVLGFFGGSRFVPIAVSFAAIAVGALFFLIWPPVQGWLVSAGGKIAGTGPIGTFFYGFIMRLSGAVGLHHMIYPIFWYSELGGVEQVAGVSVAGAQKIFFAQLADPAHTGLFTEGTRYFAGRFDTMIFGLPGAALAMYLAVPKERRGKYKGLFFSVALTSIITGITEPLEFMFLFVAPLLYVMHAFFDGLSFLIADLLDIRIGNTFSGGLIDFSLFGILQGQSRTHWLYVIPVGIVWFFLYFFTFRFFIARFNIPTPGRVEDIPDTAAPMADAAGQGSTAAQIIAALGGADNIVDVDACATRLRVAVNAPQAVDKAALKALGAVDVLQVAGGVQAIFGGKAVIYKNEVNTLLGRES